MLIVLGYVSFYPYNQRIRMNCEFVEFYGNTPNLRLYNVNNILNSLKWSSCSGCRCRQDKDFLTTLTNNITNEEIWVCHLLKIDMKEIKLDMIW